MLMRLKVAWPLSRIDRKELITSGMMQEYLNIQSRPRVVAIVQARTTSTRFPNKIYYSLNGTPILFHVLNNLKLCKTLDDVIVASPHELWIPDSIHTYIQTGDENDVLLRYRNCAVDNRASYVVRITSDCPFIDHDLVDFVVIHSVMNRVDYGSNVVFLTFPDGVDTEVISLNTLEFLNSTVKNPYNREHVTVAIRDNKDLLESFNTLSVENDVDFSKTKWSIDTMEDLKRLEIE